MCFLIFRFQNIFKKLSRVRKCIFISSLIYNIYNLYIIIKLYIYIYVLSKLTRYSFSIVGGTKFYSKMCERKVPICRNDEFRRETARCQFEAIDPQLIMHVCFRFTHGCLLHYTRFTYVSSTTGPTLRVIMARICVTRNTMANTGERQIEKG